jgi:hypothetical protein
MLYQKILIAALAFGIIATQSFAACSDKYVYDETNGVTLASGGSWGDAAGKTTLNETTTGVHSGSSALQIDMTWAAGYYGGGWGWNWTNWNAANAYDVSGNTALEFWIKASKTWTMLPIWLSDGSGTPSAKVDVATILSGGITTTWQKVSIPLSKFSGNNLKAIYELDGDTHANPWGSAGGVTIFLDDVKFVCAVGAGGSGSVCPVGERSMHGSRLTMVVTDAAGGARYFNDGTSFDLTGRMIARGTMPAHGSRVAANTFQR